MTCKAVLFDLDGTLTDTLADIAAAMNRALRLHGLPEFAVEEYKYLVGDGAAVLARRACRERTEMVQSVRETYQAYYQEHSLVLTRPYEGVPEMLRALSDAGVALAVFSNKPHADTCRVVAHFFPEIPFAVVRGQLPEVPVKPDPAGALAAAEAMGVAPGEFLYLGDTGVDMTCALRAGMHPIGVLWGFRQADELLDAGAEKLIAHPSELLNEIGM